jgi:hypothetical protein
MARIQRWWQLYPREWWVTVALWVTSSLLITHYVLHGGTDASWFLVSLACGFVAYGIVLAARFIPLWHKHRL